MGLGTLSKVDETVREAVPCHVRPRGVLDCRATDRDDPTEVPRFGVWGKQSCKDTGALNSKRMETLEDDLLAHSVAFMQLEDPALFATFSSWR